MASAAADRSQLFPVRLVDLDPDFLLGIPAEERDQARAVMVGTIELSQGDFDPLEAIGSAGGWYGLLLEGMLNRLACIGDHIALRVLGPLAVVPAFDVASSEVFATSQWSMASDGRMAVLGEEFLLSARRWPQLYTNLLARLAEQNEQLVTQLVLCQLPRVEDRLLAMLWLLSDSWGKVTSAGTVLPLHFTHEALGAMVGARRSTVTLALTKLTERGAVVPQDGGWLLLEPPPQQLKKVHATEPPRLLDLSPTVWQGEQQRISDGRDEREALLTHVSHLRAEHQAAIGRLRERLRHTEAIRNQAVELRARLRDERQARKGVPPAA